jgi:hypothetical protein
MRRHVPPTLTHACHLTVPSRELRLKFFSPARATSACTRRSAALRDCRWSRRAATDIIAFR